MAGNVTFAPRSVGDVVPVALPAVGPMVEYSYTLPVGFLYLVESFGAFLTVAGAGANRELYLDFVNGGVIVSEATFGVTVAPGAGTVRRLCFAVGASVNTGTGTYTAPLPVVYLVGGSVITTRTVNFNAADQYTQGEVCLRRWRS